MFFDFHENEAAVKIALRQIILLVIKVIIFDRLIDAIHQIRLVYTVPFVFCTLY